MIKALAHACVYSSDLARTEAFFLRYARPENSISFLKDGKLFGYYLRISDSQFIEVLHREGNGYLGQLPIGHLCLKTEDLDRVREVLEAQGVKTTEPKLGADHSWQMWCADPDGTPIEFHQYTQESTQYTGADCVVNW